MKYRIECGRCTWSCKLSFIAATLRKTLSKLVLRAAEKLYFPRLGRIYFTKSESKSLNFLLCPRQKWRFMCWDIQALLPLQCPSRCLQRRWWLCLSQSRGRSTPTPSRGGPWWPSTSRTTTRRPPSSSRWRFGTLVQPTLTKLYIFSVLGIQWIGL